MNVKKYLIIGLVLLVLALPVLVFLIDSKQHSPYHVDVSGVEMEPIHISRFEKVLFDINPFQIRDELKPYVEEFYFFLGDEIDNPMAQQQLYDYVTDPAIIDLYNETIKVYPDLKQHEDDLTKAFTYYSYYFPDLEIPNVYSYVSGLDLYHPVKYDGSNIAIALDMYLGRDFSKYRRVGIPSYQLMRRAPQFITRDVMYTIAEAKISKNIKPESLVDFMVYEGIKLYFLDCMLPHVHDTLKIGYTSFQEYWMEKNKGHVWSYFLDNNLLYSTNRHQINSFITDAPFTSPFSGNSSPRVAVWIGWQIVREYMKRNTDVSLDKLVEMSDAEEIFVKSRYKP